LNGNQDIDFRSAEVGAVRFIGDVALLDTVAKFPLDLQSNPGKRTFWLAVAVLRYFFGPDWVEEHVGFGRTTPGFLRLISSDVDKTESERSAFKIADLGEVLLNLQAIEGFGICVDKMRRGDIESSYAELDLGRMLYASGINFRFVRPQQVKGLDYDVEIILHDGCVVCADAKCKINTTEFSENTVKHSLQKARGQFPKDRPSIIFMKVPQRWLEQAKIGKSLNEIAIEFLRGTGRIVSVEFYVEELIWRDGLTTHNLMFTEISNPNNRFDKARNWDMFANPNEAGTWSTMPARWRRLLYYPEDGPNGPSWPRY
jgi:hypothetical protein